MDGNLGEMGEGERVHRHVGGRWLSTPDRREIEDEVTKPRNQLAVELCIRPVESIEIRLPLRPVREGRSKPDRGSDVKNVSTRLVIENTSADEDDK